MPLADGGLFQPWVHATDVRLVFCWSLQSRTLESEGQQDSVPLAEAVEAYAAAHRSAGGAASPSERSISFAGGNMDYLHDCVARPCPSNCNVLQIKFCSTGLCSVQNGPFCYSSLLQDLPTGLTRCAIFAVRSCRSSSWTRRAVRIDIVEDLMLGGPVPNHLLYRTFAGADAATSATQSELDPSDFAAAPSLSGLRASRHDFLPSWCQTCHYLHFR